MLHYVQTTAEYTTLHYVLQFIGNIMCPIFIKF